MSERPPTIHDVADIASAAAPLAEALGASRSAVLIAPPGTGKTTRLPSMLLAAGAAGPGTILMLEPRRVAARSAAEYMARCANEQLGQTVGVRTRGFTKVGPTTRIEVITERLLVRRLLDDPALDGVGLVIFDEVHERSLATDLGLAMTLDVVRGLRDDLAVLAMSATPDVDALVGVLGTDDSAVTVVSVAATAHPVVTHYVGRDHRQRLDDAVVDTVLTALRDTPTGDVLVFVPGRGEIRRVIQRLASSGLPNTVIVHQLTGGNGGSETTAALRPAPRGHRKIIVSTSVAQTSLTIDGVNVVVDAGLERLAVHDHATGIDELVTHAVSRAAADQRRGRAGRQGPGTAYRLWSATDETHRRAHSEPEIATSSLLSTVLELAAWGVSDPTAVQWLSPPPPLAWDAARDAATRRHLIDTNGSLTAAGRRVVALGTDPALAVMMLNASSAATAAVAPVLAAVIEDGARGDLATAVASATPQQRELAARWQRVIGPGQPRATKLPTGAALDDAVATCLVAGFPERIARRRPEQRHEYLTAGGLGTELADGAGIAPDEWLAVAAIERDARRRHRIVSAVPLRGSVLASVLDDATPRAELSEFAPGEFRSSIVRAVGAISVSSVAGRPERAEIVAALEDHIRRRGVDGLHWSDGARTLQQRIEFARTIDPTISAVSGEALAGSAGRWLDQQLRVTGSTVRLGDVEASAVLTSVLDWRDRQRVDELAPTHHVVPSGRSVVIDYSGEAPALAVKLQEMFGEPTTPSVGGGRVPLVLHLLSPAGRPLQITSDLAAFWAGSYAAVRSEMRGRYPKHPWPEDPTNAEATARVKHPRGRVR